MQVNTTTHIAPIVLWRNACGGMKLTGTDYEHVSHCPGCETLANEMHEALDDIETALRMGHTAVS